MEASLGRSPDEGDREPRGAERIILGKPRPWSGWNYYVEKHLKEKISDMNRALVTEYLSHLEGKKNCKDSTLAGNIHCLAKLDRYMVAQGKKIEEVTTQDLARFFTMIRADDGSEMEESTKTTVKAKVKALLSWKFRDDPARRTDLIRDIKISKPLGVTKTADDMLTVEQVKAMVEAADNLRDKAVVAVLYESGLRFSEFRCLRIEDVHFRPRGTAKILLPKGFKGLKTGAREVYILWSVPHLQQWLRVHPDRNNPRAPLWPPIHHGRRDIPVSDPSLRRTVERVAKRAGIEKRVHPHLLRHSQATEWARQGIAESMQREQFGWARGSDMPSHYIHLAGVDIENTILEKSGQKAPEPKEPARLSAPCHFCGELNPTDVSYCIKCFKPVSVEVLAKLEKQDRQIQRQTLKAALTGDLSRAVQDPLVQELRRDPQFQRVLEGLAVLAGLAGGKAAGGGPGELGKAPPRRARGRSRGSHPSR